MDESLDQAKRQTGANALGQPPMGLPPQMGQPTMG